MTFGNTPAIAVVDPNPLLGKCRKEGMTKQGVRLGLLLGIRPGLLPWFCFRDTPTPRARKPGVDRRPQRTQPRSRLSRAPVAPRARIPAAGRAAQPRPPRGSSRVRIGPESIHVWVEDQVGRVYRGVPRLARPCQARAGCVTTPSRCRHDDPTQQRQPRHQRDARHQRQAGQRVARPALSPVAGASRRRGSRVGKVSPGSPTHPGRRRHPLSPCARMAQIPAPQRGPA